MAKKEENKCIVCGKPLKGRSDMLFCSNACKAKYNRLEAKKQIDKELAENPVYELLTQFSQLTQNSAKDWKNFIEYLTIMKARGFENDQDYYDAANHVLELFIAVKKHIDGAMNMFITGFIKDTGELEKLCKKLGISINGNINNPEQD